MRASRIWLRVVSRVVPADDRPAWLEEWSGELAATGDSMRHAWGALADAWCLRTAGWTLDALLRDVRVALRSLARRPSFTLVGGFTLAVGIGATTAIYSVVDAVLVDPLPLPEADRVVSYNHQAPNLGVNVPLVPHSEAMYLHYAESAEAVSDLGLYNQTAVTMMTDGEPVRLDALVVTSSYFRVMGVEPVVGRSLAVGDDDPGAEPVVVLGHALWVDAFGADQDVVGRLVEIDGVQRRVTGVMPDDLGLTDEQLWLPMVIDRAAADEGTIGLVGVARLAEGQTMESANVEMQALLERYAEGGEGLGQMISQAGLRADVKPLKEVFFQGLRQPLLILLGTVAFVLLIACANVANLFLVQTEARQREAAVRTAMGASRLDVARLCLSESVALAVLGGVAGTAMAWLGVRGLMRLVPGEMPHALDVGIDGSVLTFTALVSVAAGLFFGLFPALGYGRRPVGELLREGGRSSTSGRQRHRLRRGLVVAQVALALVLLVGSGLMLRSFGALRDVTLGFEPQGLLTFRYALPQSRYGDAEAIAGFHRNLHARLQDPPGVVSVGIISGLPLTRAKMASPFEPVDRPVDEDQLAPMVEIRQATPGYFDAMAIDLVEGRPFEWTDQADGFRGAVVSEALARSFWPGESAVGRELRSQGADNHSWEIIGVARDVRFDGIEDEPLPMLYQPLLRGDVGEEFVAPSVVDVAVRTSGGDPLDALASARAALGSLDPALPIINPRTMESIVTEAFQGTSFTVVLLGIAAGIALLLGTVGLYGVVSFIVARRTQEIGLRMALGAPAQRVLREVVGQGMSLTGLGLTVGLVGAWGLSRVLASLLYGVSASDPATFVGTALLLGSVSLLATWIPARRAARVDPVEALRRE